MSASKSAPILAGILVLLAGLVGTGFWYTFRDNGELDDALEALRLQQYDKARQLLLDRLERRPQDAHAHLLLSRVLRRMIPDDLTLARQHLTAARQLLGPNPEVELEEAMLICQSGWRARETEADLAGRVASPETPGDVRLMIYEALVRGHIRAGRLNAAIRWLDRWIEALPGQADAHRWRACLLEYQQRPHLALEDYRALAAMQPDNRTLRDHQGVLLAESGYDYQQAIQLLGEDFSSRHDPRTVTAQAICFYGLGDLVRARQAVGRALRLDPSYVPAWLWSARIALEAGDAQAGLQAARHALAMLPGVSSRQAKVALLEQRSPPLAHPTTYLERLQQLEIQALNQLGSLQQLQQAMERYRRTQECLARWNQLVENTPAVPDLDNLYQAAQLQLELADCDEAETLVQRLLEQAPDYPGAMQLLHDCHERRYQARQAMENPPTITEP
ncbi:MAG: hypothetical protein KatS3mg110_3248 [Pirellulaceae bacterium]|nr:MAG: hypothetical protein KatS3mg110_3248 [Pirellulaceae bacterium]